MKKHEREAAIKIIGQMIVHANDKKMIEDFEKVAKRKRKRDVYSFMDKYCYKNAQRRQKVYLKCIDRMEEIDHKLKEVIFIINDAEFKKYTRNLNNQIKQETKDKSSNEKFEILHKKRNDNPKIINDCEHVISVLKTLDDLRLKVSLHNKNIEYMHKEINDLASLVDTDKKSYILSMSIKESKLLERFHDGIEGINSKIEELKSQKTQILKETGDIYQLDVLKTDPEIYHDYFLDKKIDKSKKATCEQTNSL